MKRITTLAVSILLLCVSCLTEDAAAKDKKTKEQPTTKLTDREIWVDVAYKIAEPVLRNMSNGELSKTMIVESPAVTDGRDTRLALMEAFGRLMDGIAPWLALPDDQSEEGSKRKQLREWALKCYANAVDPQNPDYLMWRKNAQPLVDAAFLASSLLRAKDQLWEPLDSITKARYIDEFKRLRGIDPPYNNWLLFSATIEAFLLSTNNNGDMYRIDNALRKIDEWYVGDGWYADGPHFAFDYYGSFVIHPMYNQVLEVLKQKQAWKFKGQYEKAVQRTQRFSIILERLIANDGSFALFGRSMTYRLAAFQPLAILAWKEQLPKELSQGQVRAALTATIKKCFGDDRNFNEQGFLLLGLYGSQPEIADVYTNTGSLYLTSEIFPALGLPENHSFWTAPEEPWTQKRAWNSEPFLKDHAVKNLN